MNVTGQARKVLQYLYKHQDDNGHIYGSISFNLGLGSAEKSEEICKTLYTDNLAEFRNDRVFITDSGRQWINSGRCGRKFSDTFISDYFTSFD